MRKESSPARASHRSRRLLRQAVTGLLDAREPGGITITDIVAEAGVSRPTFYAAYPDLGAAFTDAAMTRLADAFSGVNPDVSLFEPGTPGVINPSIRHALGNLEPHAEFFARVLGGPSGVRIIGAVIDYVAARIVRGSVLGPALEGGPLTLPVAAHALAAGAVWATADWVFTDAAQRRSLDELSSDIGHLLIRSAFGGLTGVGAVTSGTSSSPRHIPTI